MGLKASSNTNHCGNINFRSVPTQVTGIERKTDYRESNGSGLDEEFTLWVTGILKLLGLKVSSNTKNCGNIHFRSVPTQVTGIERKTDDRESNGGGLDQGFTLWATVIQKLLGLKVSSYTNFCGDINYRSFPTQVTGIERTTDGRATAAVY